MNLLDDTTNQPSKFRTRNWVGLNDEKRAAYNNNNNNNNNNDNDIFPKPGSTGLMSSGG